MPRSATATKDHQPAAESAPVGTTAVRVGPADDQYERAADATAASVVARLQDTDTPLPPLSSEPATVAPTARRVPASTAAGPEGGTLDGETSSRISRARQGGESLPVPVRRSFESAFGGADLGGVRLHAGSEAATLNDSVGARAFTVGNDIFFRNGMPDTSTEDGQHLLAHEIAHTLQRSPVARRDFVPGFTKPTKPTQQKLDEEFGGDGHGTANDVMEMMQGGTSAPGELNSQNSYQDNLKKAGVKGQADKVGSETDGNNLTYAAGAMSAFDLALQISKTVQMVRSGTADPWKIAGAALGILSSGTTLGGGIADIVKAATGADDKSAAAVASGVLGSITSGINIIAKGKDFVQQFIDLVKDCKENSTAAVVTSVIGLVKTLVESAKGVLEFVNSIYEKVSSVTGAMLSAVPALGIAINVLDILMSGVNLVSAWISWAEMRLDKRGSKEKVLGRAANKSAGIRGFFGGHESAEGTAKGKIAAWEQLKLERQAAIDAKSAAATDLVSAKEARQKVVDRIGELEKKKPLTATEKKELTKLKNDLKVHDKTVAAKEKTAQEKEDAEKAKGTELQNSEQGAKDSRDYLASKDLQYITGKRIRRQVLNISTVLPALAGDIAILSGVGAGVGGGLKIASGGAKLLATGVRMAKQAYHDKQGETDPKSRIAKLKTYDRLIGVMSDHVIEVDAFEKGGGDPKVVAEMQAKAEREITASGMTKAKLARLTKDPDPNKAYIEWVKALMAR